jgi:hypothetical protein
MSEPGSDPIADFQRWLMKAGARSLGRDVASKVRSTMGGGSSSGKRAGVWETATTEPPGDEPPECQWCPICRAARRYRESGGTDSGLGSQLAGVGDALAGLTRDAFGIFEAAMRASQRQTGQAPRPDAPGTSGDSDSGGRSDYGTVVGPGVAWPTAIHAEHEDGEAAHEGGDREEGLEPGDGPADGSGDEQIEGPSE